MAAATSFLEADVPRPLLYAGVPVAALFLISLFVFLGFPYDRLSAQISQQLTTLSGRRVEIGEIEPAITIGGPGFTAEGVRIDVTPQQSLEIDSLRVRPAWSLSWFRARPALYVDLRSSTGDARGTVVIASEPSWVGELSELDLSLIPIPPSTTVTGTLVADADLVFGADGATGTLLFEASDGSLSHDRLPMGIQYEKLQGDVVLGGNHIAQIRELALDGPMLTATLEGNITRGKRPGGELLDLNGEVQINGMPMQAMLSSFGVPLDADGRASFSVGGTLHSPKLR